MGKAVRSFQACYRCKATDPPGGFYSNGYCRECGKQYNNDRRQKNLDKVRGQHRDHYARHREKIQGDARLAGRKLKVEAIAAYGGRCACPGCPENTTETPRIEFLAIDHINGGGLRHRKEIGKSGGAAFYRWLRDNNYPEGFRCLCANCNTSLGMLGYCPHVSPDRSYEDVSVYVPKPRYAKGE